MRMKRDNVCKALSTLSTLSKHSLNGRYFYYTPLPGRNHGVSWTLYLPLCSGDQREQLPFSNFHGFIPNSHSPDAQAADRGGARCHRQGRPASPAREAGAGLPTTVTLKQHPCPDGRAQGPTGRQRGLRAAGVTTDKMAGRACARSLPQAATGRLPGGGLSSAGCLHLPPPGLLASAPGLGNMPVLGEKSK